MIYLMQNMGMPLWQIIVCVLAVCLFFGIGIMVVTRLLMDDWARRYRNRYQERRKSELTARDRYEQAELIETLND